MQPSWKSASHLSVLHFLFPMRGGLTCFPRFLGSNRPRPTPTQRPPDTPAHKVKVSNPQIAFAWYRDQHINTLDCRRRRHPQRSNTAHRRSRRIHHVHSLHPRGPFHTPGWPRCRTLPLVETRSTRNAYNFWLTSSPPSNLRPLSNAPPK